MIKAEEVLEGHFRHLSKGPQRSTQNVSVQVGSNLTAAITVLSPTLAPLAELAEEVAQVVPQVQPAPQFRANLHKALERAHRQHAAQRVLGTRPPAAPEPAAEWIDTTKLTLAAALLAILFVYWWNYSSQPAAPGEAAL
jgi:hypothetical protein